jgi:hypothetical protein
MRGEMRRETRHWVVVLHMYETRRSLWRLGGQHDLERSGLLNQCSKGRIGTQVSRLLLLGSSNYGLNAETMVHSGMQVASLTTRKTWAQAIRHTPLTHQPDSLPRPFLFTLISVATCSYRARP